MQFFCIIWPQPFWPQFLCTNSCLKVTFEKLSPFMHSCTTQRAPFQHLRIYINHYIFSTILWYFLDPRRPLVAPSFARLSARIWNLKPYKSPQSCQTPDIWNIAVNRRMSSIIRWWIQRQKQIQIQNTKYTNAAHGKVPEKTKFPCTYMSQTRK